MAKFYGKIGFGQSVESAPGVFKDVPVEKDYYGDVLRDAIGFESGEKVNNDLTVSNSISIVGDAYANLNFHMMRYVSWAGTRWEISNVEVKSPRLILRLGGVYNGPTP